MKKKEFKELKTKKVAELLKEVSEKKNEVTKYLSGMYAGREKNLKKAKSLRRDIAQILTVVKEKEVTEEKEGK